MEREERKGGREKRRREGRDMEGREGERVGRKRGGGKVIEEGSEHEKKREKRKMCINVAVYTSCK